MSSGPNHRRGHERITDNGPAWESPTPCAGCNSTHVARSRAKWKRLKSRRRRRVNKNILQHLEEDTPFERNRTRCPWGST